ncbi:low-specificity L-threonine aldolase [Escherichia coli]|nr:low-specificity L-threonine aldolase [Escherichia coli]
MIDLRSDTVTRPSRAMLEAMMAAPVGDDVYGDDPTVNALQDYAAELSGKEAAIFLPTGTQANLVALLSHCERGEEYIVGQAAHNYLFEAGGAAVLGSIQPQPIDAAADGTLPLDKVAMKIKPDDIHFARTKLLSLENTHNGKVLPREYLKEAWEFTRERNLALHVDGARIFNAIVAYGCELKEITQYCDSFTICLSKGLGTPVGSLLVGNRDYIKRAIRWRKMTGGGMRQSGILAAAGMYALKNNVARLQEDHDNAAWMAEQLREAGADVMRQDTNMLFVRVGEENAAALGEYMKARNVLINASPIVRLVTHLDVSREQLAEVAAHWRVKEGDVPQRILVLGASGYIGQHLVRTLSQQGHQTLAAARHVDRLAKLQLANVSCHKVDLSWPDNLPALLQDIDTVYFLVHSMGEGGDFIAQERQVALNVRDALREVPVKQLIFLSSLQAPPHEQSDHLRARQATADILREAGVPVTELRAGIIVGAGSAAFEVMRDMVYNLPVLTPPRWVRSRTTPIALENLLHYLVALLDHPACEHRIFEAAGPEVLSYQQQFEHFMAVSGKRRWLIPIPLPTRWISVWFLNVITSVPPTTARALIQGLKHDLLADDTELRALIPQRLIAFDDAVRRTLKEEEKLVNSSDWGYDAQAFARWRPEYGYFAKQAGFTVKTSASLAALWLVVNQIGGKERYFFGNILWQTRALMDRAIGHKLAKGRPEREYLQTGDAVDSWKVIVVEPQKQLTLLFGMKAPGLGRLCFTLEDKGDYRTIDVRAFWHPHGMPGLFYWLLMIPAHLFIFRGMAKRIARLAEQSTD